VSHSQSLHARLLGTRSCLCCCACTPTHSVAVTATDRDTGRFNCFGPRCSAACEPAVTGNSVCPPRNSYYAVTVVIEAAGQRTQGTGPDLPTFVLSCASVDMARKVTILQNRIELLYFSTINADTGSLERRS
jgi:hypothetical protein